MRKQIEEVESFVAVVAALNAAMKQPAPAEQAEKKVIPKQGK